MAIEKKSGKGCPFFGAVYAFSVEGLFAVG
jgi:hypothetical protein